MNTNVQVTSTAVLVAITGAVLMAFNTVATAMGPGSKTRATYCELINSPSGLNPACMIPVNGSMQSSTIDGELYYLCEQTKSDETKFKNDSDRIGLVAKSIDAAMKVEEEKCDPDAMQKIEDYITKLDSLESGTVSEVTAPGEPKSKAKIDEYDKVHLLQAVYDAKACLEDIIMTQSCTLSAAAALVTAETTATETTATETTATETTATETATTETTTEGASSTTP